MYCRIKKLTVTESHPHPLTVTHDIGFHAHQEEIHTFPTHSLCLCLLAYAPIAYAP
jgi:hypothetical protein